MSSSASNTYSTVKTMRPDSHVTLVQLRRRRRSGARPSAVGDAVQDVHPTEEAQSDEHYADFFRTYSFLRDSAAEGEALAAELREQREALLDYGSTPSDDLLQSMVVRKDAIADRLRAVMVRTERLGVTDDREGMLTQVADTESYLETGDISSYVRLRRIADLVEAADPLEYWKSAPYALSFMDDYRFKVQFRNALADRSREKSMSDVLAIQDGCALPPDRIGAYLAVDPANRLCVVSSTKSSNRVGRGAEFGYPALSYYRLTGVYEGAEPHAFTKRLIFSSWRVVPKAIATMVSYEVERRIVSHLEATTSVVNSVDGRNARGFLLQFRISDGRRGVSRFWDCCTPAPPLPAPWTRWLSRARSVEHVRRPLTRPKCGQSVRSNSYSPIHVFPLESRIGGRALVLGRADPP